MRKPDWKAEGHKLYLGDCLDILPELEGGLAVVSDPPYGMNCDVDWSRFSGGSPDSVKKRGLGRKYDAPIIGDDMPFDPTPFLLFDEVILWGFNHFASRLPVGRTLVWIKRNDAAFGSFLSDAELAWMKGGCGVYCRRDLSNNSRPEQRKHPTQKPIPLMEWCVGLVSAQTILDPFTGSGTTGVACVNLDRRFIGIEKEPKYFEIAVKRMEQAIRDKKSQLPFMREPQPVQKELIA